MNERKITIFVLIIGMFISGGMLYLDSKNKTSVDNKKANDLIEESIVLEQKTVIIKNDTNEEIRDSLKKIFNEAEIGSSSANFYQIVNADKSVLPVSRISQASNFYINENVMKFVDENEYELLTCLDKDNQRSNGIVLKFRTGAADDDFQIYNELVANMKNWQSSMLKDLSPIIFSNNKQDELIALNPNLVFKEDAYVTAQVNLPGGKKTKIVYIVKGSAVIITNSLECTGNADAILEQ